MVKMSAYPFPMQVDIVMTCCMLHNFIRRNQLYRDQFDKLDDAMFTLGYDQRLAPDIDAYIEDFTGHAACVTWRDDIAERMWVAYQAELARRRAEGRIA